MNNIRPIWTPQDAVDTAQQFHLELHNAERGEWTSTNVELQRQSSTRLGNGLIFRRSRFRRAKIMDGLAVALFMVFMLVFGALMAIGYAPHAKASPATESYADIYGGVVCNVLDEYPTVAGVLGVGQGISEESGFTLEQAGEVIAYSVFTYCPWHKPLLNRFIATYSSSETAGQIA